MVYREIYAHADVAADVDADVAADVTSDVGAGDATHEVMDTICQIIIDESGDIVVGTSTNGLSHKVPG